MFIGGQKRVKTKANQCTEEETYTEHEFILSYLYYKYIIYIVSHPSGPDLFVFWSFSDLFYL